MNVMTQVMTTEQMHTRAGKVIEENIAAWDWWEDGASDEEVTKILSGFVAPAVVFHADAACHPTVSSLPSLKGLMPAIAATQLAGGFDDFLMKCDALAEAMGAVQHELD